MVLGEEWEARHRVEQMSLWAQEPGAGVVTLHGWWPRSCPGPPTLSPLWQEQMRCQPCFPCPLFLSFSISDNQLPKAANAQTISTSSTPQRKPQQRAPVRPWDTRDESSALQGMGVVPFRSRKTFSLFQLKMTWENLQCSNLILCFLSLLCDSK